jgi:hypothetical protein
VPILTLAMVRARIPKSILIECLDRDDDGVEDTVVTDQLIADAESLVRGYAEAIYPDLYTNSALYPPYPNELIRLTLDAFHALLGQRYPEFVRIDGYKMMNEVRKELEMMRKAKTTMGKAPPDPSAIQGGFVASVANDPFGFQIPFTQDFGNF